MSGTPLRLLVVEDSEDDALLVLRVLRRGGFDPVHLRVDTAEAMRAALAGGNWDAVTCDYVMPHFSGLAALALLQECKLDLPFIVVSGKIGEETAVEAMKAGAHDYVMKTELQRLPAAMRRELQEARDRHDRRSAEHDVARMHAQMAQAHKEWLQAFDSISDPVFLHDKEYRIMRANQAYAERAGCAFSDLLGRRYWEVFPRGEGPLPGCCETVAATQPAQEEITLPDGSVYVSRASPIKDEDGAYLYSIHVMEDVTARKAAERALARSERYYRKLIEGGSDVFFLLDRDGRLRYRSDSGTRITGWKTDEVLGRNVAEFVAEQHVPLVGRMIAETQANPGKEYTFELPGKRKDGSLVDLEITVKNLCHDPDIDGIVVTARDLSERKRAEHSLRLFRALLDHSNDAIQVIEPKTLRFLDVNDAGCRQLGYSREELLAMSIFEVDPSIDRAVMEDVDLRLAQSGSVRFETSHRRKDGSTYPVEINLTRAHLERDYQLAVVRDITERKQSEEALLRLNRSLRTLSAGNEALVRATDEANLLCETARVIHELGGYSQCIVAYSVDDARQSLDIKACAGVDMETLTRADISWGNNERGQHALARALRTGKPQIGRDLTRNREFAPWREQAQRLGMGALCGLPLQIGNARPFGALAIVAAERDAFDAEEQRLLQELASDLAFGIDTLRTRAERDRIAAEQVHHGEVLRRSLEDSIKAIATTVEMRDPYTAGHQKRVAQLAAAIARELDMSQETIHGIEIAASIHDLGKINVPSEILSKPTQLSEVELMLVRNHCQAGFDILKGIQSPWPIAQMVHQHHERLDGSGYPLGLKGEDILLESRILAVADVVEAMASHRPYRPALGSASALEEIRCGRGTLYDAAAVDACLALFAEKRFTLAT